MSRSARSAASVVADPTHAPADPPIRYACAGCGYEAPPAGPVPFRCPNAVVDDDIDHVLGRRLVTTPLSFPDGGDPNPFIRYRTLSHAYHLARTHGWTDAAYVALVERLDAGIARVDGTGFRVTPLARQDALSDRLGFGPDGGVIVKDETRNVAGSHKARHLMGTLLELEVATSIAGTSPRRARLAIASCGNAALAAAVLARAAGRELDVFIPTDAHAAVVKRLETLGANLVVCERQAGVAGDPTYHRLRAAIDHGAIPFTCQGNENGFAVEGGVTLGYELATGFEGLGGGLPKRLFIQVGGGALAASCVQGLAEARQLGGTTAEPMIHPVQAAAVAPLARAHARLETRLDADGPTDDDIAWAAHHRSAFMWPWEAGSPSIATGILDDETYDWLAVVRGTLASGGAPVVVDEATLGEANTVARETTGIDVDPTGSAGLAGLIELRRHGVVGSHELVAVIFTGAQRDRAAPDHVSAPQVGGPP